MADRRAFPFSNSSMLDSNHKQYLIPKDKLVEPTPGAKTYSTIFFIEGNATNGNNRQKFVTSKSS